MHLSIEERSDKDRGRHFADSLESFTTILQHALTLLQTQGLDQRIESARCAVPWVAPHRACSATAV
jgi:hypothetical protein